LKNFNIYKKKLDAPNETDDGLHGASQSEKINTGSAGYFYGSPKRSRKMMLTILQSLF
jgi:hypothetical protein